MSQQGRKKSYKRPLSTLLMMLLTITFLTVFNYGGPVYAAEPDTIPVMSQSYQMPTAISARRKAEAKPEPTAVLPPPSVLLERQKNKPEPAFTPHPDIPLDAELQVYTYELCEEMDVEYELLLALMWQESKFKVDSIGYNTNGTKDVGLMMINDINRGWIRDDLGITDLMDPRQNILAGATILGDYTSRYDERTSLMAYQMGEYGMKKAKARGVTTTKVAEGILNKRDEFQRIYSEGPGMKSI